MFLKSSTDIIVSGPLEGFTKVKERTRRRKKTVGI